MAQRDTSQDFGFVYVDIKELLKQNRECMHAESADAIAAKKIKSNQRLHRKLQQLLREANRLQRNLDKRSQAWITNRRKNHSNNTGINRSNYYCIDLQRYVIEVLL